MTISIFSQSLFALPLDEAIRVACETGYAAVELACAKPHFDAETAMSNSESVAAFIRDSGLRVSALSLFNNFTDAQTLEAQVDRAAMFISLASLFETKIVKLTPGPPSSKLATQAHWECLLRATEQLVPLAQQAGVRLAFETHMNQLTDTLASSKRLLEAVEADAVGMTVDFSNMSFAGEKSIEVIESLKGSIYNTHLKNGYIDTDGQWQFRALDEGLTDYVVTLKALRESGYDGYLSIECLGRDAKERPRETAGRDRDILRRYLAEVGWSEER